MKRRSIEPDVAANAAENSLCQALLALSSVADMRAFLRDLCTPAEREAMTDRWHVVPLIIEGVPYRDIHEQTGVSITTVGRVARCLNDGTGGYAKALKAIGPRKRGARKMESKA